MPDKGTGTVKMKLFRTRKVRMIGGGGGRMIKASWTAGVCRTSYCMSRTRVDHPKGRLPQYPS